MSWLEIFEEPEKIKLDNTYHEDSISFRKMFEIQDKVCNSKKRKIILDAVNCTYISPTCLMILSSLILYTDENKSIQISFKKGSKLRQKFMEFGLLNIKTDTKSKNDIPLYLIQNDDDAYLKIEQFIECSPLRNIPQDKKDIIISRLYEIPYNALHHSNSAYGVICGGYYTKKNEFVFSVYDLGIGIPTSVRNYLKKSKMSSSKAIDWALKSGNSTRAGEYSRGLGFFWLEDFKKTFNGKITLISEDIIYTSGKGNPKKSNLKIKMPGTLYTIKIVV